MAASPHDESPDPYEGKALSIDVETVPAGVIVRLTGSCTMDLAEDLGASLMRVAAEDPPVLVLDLAALDFIDSGGLGAIISAHMRCRRKQGELRVVGPKPQIMRVLTVTRLTQLLRIYKTCEEALADPVTA